MALSLPYAVGRSRLRAVSASPAPPSPDSPIEPPSSSPSRPAPIDINPALGLHPAPGGRTRLYVILTAVAVTIIVVLVVILAGYHHLASSSSSSEVLAPVGWNANSLPYEQFGDVPFIAHSSVTITGSFITSNEITVYIMNETQFEVLVKTLSLDGYEYTTGQEWQGTINATVGPGNWELVFYASNPSGSSGVAITTAVVLTPT